MNIQNEVQKIHNQYGVSEIANYKIQLLFEKYAKEYCENEKLNKPIVVQSNDIHVCRYSKSMNQPYPRLCVDCGKPENH